MPPSVHWMGRAKIKVARVLIPLFETELCQIFPDSNTITVDDAFEGYSRNQFRKINLAVEVHTGDSYDTHVVKLGLVEEVGPDYDGWQACFSHHPFASRIFVPVTMYPLSPKDYDLSDDEAERILEEFDLAHDEADRLLEYFDRAGIVYQNAYTFFGPDERTEPLETVVEWAVFDDQPDPASVERVIRQIFGDLYHWFYHNSPPDHAAAFAFYKLRLKFDDPQKDLLTKWAEEEWRLELRQDTLWVASMPGVLKPTLAPLLYEDPIDYVGWAMLNDCIPQTLVGRSHGDIHGRNIIVGVRRGEAEYPAAFDYGEMGDHNVLAWDFVKLETELKVRLLKRLCQGRPDDTNCTEGTDWRSVRADQLAFAFRFETLLADLTERINTVADPAALYPPGGRNITGDNKTDRALGILMRIRQEAALYLGNFQQHRENRGNWRDEYYFALAVYGSATAKFDYHKCEAAFVLVSAGVAVAHMALARTKITSATSAKGYPPPDGRYPYPSVTVPIAQAHRIWQGQRLSPSLEDAAEILKNALRCYPHSMALRQEYALVLAELGENNDARDLLEPSRDLCVVFGDEETLSRIGRLYKDLGDISYRKDPVPVGEIGKTPAYQWYSSALECYQDAFKIAGNYFPGINAATMALLLGKDTEASAIATEVEESCRDIAPGTLTPDDRYWVFATEGEAQLILRHSGNAVKFYKDALDLLPDGSDGMAKSSYKQVCRLHGVLGEDIVRPVLTLFESSRFNVGPRCT